MKRHEKRCLHITKSNLQWFRRFHNISGDEQERPDFILSDNVETIGLEHFLVDTLWNNGSQTRKSEKSINKAKNHKVKTDETMFTIADAVSGYFHAFENFDYDTFINNFRRVFVKHLKNMPIYRATNTDKTGFLIEISVLDFEYIVSKDGEQEEKYIKGIPFTKSMWDIINQFDKVDFVIVTVLRIGSNKNKSYYFDKDHEPSMLYDSFTYDTGAIRNPFEGKMEEIKNIIE